MKQLFIAISFCINIFFVAPTELLSDVSVYWPTENRDRHGDDRPGIRVVDKLLGNGLASGGVSLRDGARRALFAPLLVHLVPIEAAALAAPAARILLVPHHDEIRVARLGTGRVGEPSQRLAPKPQPPPIQPQLRSPFLVHCTHHHRLSFVSTHSHSVPLLVHAEFLFITPLAAIPASFEPYACNSRRPSSGTSRSPSADNSGSSTSVARPPRPRIQTRSRPRLKSINLSQPFSLPVFFFPKPRVHLTVPLESVRFRAAL